MYFYYCHIIQCNNKNVTPNKIISYLSSKRKPEPEAPFMVSQQLTRLLIRRQILETTGEKESIRTTSCLYKAAIHRMKKSWPYVTISEIGIHAKLITQLA